VLQIIYGFRRITNLNDD